MNEDPDSRPDRIDRWDDPSRRFTAIPDLSRTVTTTFVYGISEPAGSKPRAFTFEHSQEKRLFVLTWSDGEVEVFRDNATRYLVVEPDDEPGELRPKLTYGRPTFLYLCREERER
jgi:hypothetical protein